MTKITTFPIDGKNIIKGQPFSVVVSVSGDDNIQSSAEISVVSPPGITLIKKFPGQVYMRIFYQQLIFQADESSNAHKIKFTANTTGNPSKEVTYNPVDNPDLNPDTCALRGASAYLYDSNPVALTGQPPTDNPFILASINPMLNNNGGPISDYDIPLRTTAPVRIFTEDMTTEFQPYEIDTENSYYYYLLQKTSKAALNLKIYTTQHVRGFIELDTVFNDEEYNQRQTIFMTTVPTNISDNLVPPSIEGTLSSSTLTRPDQADEFTVLISSYEGATAGSYIIGFTTDDKKNVFKTELFAGQITDEEGGYYKFKAAYSDLYSGANHLCYVVLDQTGMPVRSKFNYINYDSSGNNSPDPNDANRTLVAPEIYDQNGQFIDIDKAVNINSIGHKGLEVRLLSDLHKSDTTIAAGDMITVKAYISYCVDTTSSPPRSLPIVVIENHTVQQHEIIDGYYKALIKPEELMGYDASSGDVYSTIAIDYKRVAQNQKSKLFIRNFDTVAPNNSLMTPSLPQSKNSIIDESELSQHVLLIVINQYEKNHIDDYIIVQLKGKTDVLSEPLYIMDKNIHLPNYKIKIPFSNIPLGSYDVSYTITDWAGNSSSSTAKHVEIKNSDSPQQYKEAKLIINGYQLIGDEYVILTIQIHDKQTSELIKDTDISYKLEQAVSITNVVEIDSNPATLQSMNTDEYGQFKINLKGQVGGHCIIRVIANNYIGSVKYIMGQN